MGFHGPRCGGKKPGDWIGKWLQRCARRASTDRRISILPAIKCGKVPRWPEANMLGMKRAVGGRLGIRGPTYFGVADDGGGGGSRCYCQRTE